MLNFSLCIALCQAHVWLSGSLLCFEDDLRCKDKNIEHFIIPTICCHCVSIYKMSNFKHREWERNWILTEPNPVTAYFRHLDVVLVDVGLTNKPGCLWLSHRTGRRFSPPCWPAPVWGSGSRSGEALSSRSAAPPDVHTWAQRWKTKHTRERDGGVIGLDQETHARISWNRPRRHLTTWHLTGLMTCPDKIRTRLLICWSNGPIRDSQQYETGQWDVPSRRRWSYTAVYFGRHIELDG